MNAIVGSVAVGVLCGVLAYALVRLAWPSIAVQEFTNVIGLAAVVGAAVGAAVVRRRRAAAESKRPSDVPPK